LASTMPRQAAPARSPPRPAGRRSAPTVSEAAAGHLGPWAHSNVIHRDFAPRCRLARQIPPGRRTQHQGCVANRRHGNINADKTLAADVAERCWAVRRCCERARADRGRPGIALRWAGAGRTGPSRDLRSHRPRGTDLCHGAAPRPWSSTWASRRRRPGPAAHAAGGVLRAGHRGHARDNDEASCAPSTPAPTITWSNRSPLTNSTPACAPCCDGPRPRSVRPWSWGPAGRSGNPGRFPRRVDARSEPQGVRPLAFLAARPGGVSKAGAHGPGLDQPYGGPIRRSTSICHGCGAKLGEQRPTPLPARRARCRGETRRTGVMRRRLASSSLPSRAW